MKVSDSKIIKTLLLLALPASGKSELRRFMLHQGLSDFHMGPTVQLDDYPYVEFMRLTDETLVHLGHPQIFYTGPNGRFQDPREWLTLIELLNQAHADLMQPDWIPPIETASAAMCLFDRINQAQQRAGADSKLGRFPQDVFELLARFLEKPARKIVDELIRQRAKLHADGGPDSKTVVIEFARGAGSHGITMPPHTPYGYSSALSHLSSGILRSASILYVQVTPEESRRKNYERAVPPEGEEDNTGIYHGAPLSVMLGDYGVCDMQWLLEQDDCPGQVLVDVGQDEIYLSVAVFENHDDVTTMLREDPSEWDSDQVQVIRNRLQPCMDELHRQARILTQA